MSIEAYDSHKIIIVYNTKCAQTTLYGVFGKPWDKNAPSYFKQSRGLSDTGKLTEIYRPDYFTTVFVRNPYSRMTSMWAYAKGSSNQKNWPNFETWLTFCYEDWKAKTKRPRYSYLITLSYFIDDISLVDFIGRQETLEKDVKFIADKYGIEYKGIPRLNKSSNSNIKWQNCYTPKLKQFVAEMYSEDFEMFGYEK